jgi:transcription elongation factor Elf1
LIGAPVVMNLQHTSSKGLAKCSICGAMETQPGTFPMVVGVGRVCLDDGMSNVKCSACGSEVKTITSARLQGKTHCLADYMKEVEKYRQHIVQSFDENNEPAASILERAYSQAPEGYTLLAVRRGRNSTHLWEAEYEKTEIFQMRCS